MQIFSVIGAAVTRPVLSSKSMFTFALLMSYSIGIVGNLLGATSDSFLNFLLNIFDVYLLCLLLWVIGGLLRPWPIVSSIVKWVIYIIVGGLLFAELFVVFFYHSLISVHVMQLVVETNGSESSEFLCSALSTSAVWKSLAITIGIGVISWLLYRKSSNLKMSMHRNVRLAIASIGVILILWSGVRQVPNYIRIVRCCFASNTSFCEELRDSIHFNTPASRIIFGIAFNRASLKELSVMETTVAKSEVTSCSFRCPLIVLVIGESYNKYHSHLYNAGYLPTTPNLDRMENEGNLIKYNDAITPFNLTSHVFKYFFSMFDEQGEKLDNDDNWTYHTLFPALFKKAGYEVYFLTNQFVPESDDDWDAMGGTFLNNRELSKLQFSIRNKRRYQYDGELLSEMPDTVTLSTKPTLLIVHLIGQHVSYGERYPADFNRFQASMSQTTFGDDSGKESEAEYANATLYNDYVVNEIFSAVSQQDAICIYTADHGEEVYDWRDCYERTQERPIPEQVMKYQYEIPLMFYLTDEFKAKHPDITEKIIANCELPALNINLSHTLLWLGGIDSPEYNEELDILSPQYDSKRERLLWNSIPYIKSE